jgi:hypothetical protein
VAEITLVRQDHGVRQDEPNRGREDIAAEKPTMNDAWPRLDQSLGRPQQVRPRSLRSSEHTLSRERAKRPAAQEDDALLEIGQDRAFEQVED